MQGGGCGDDDEEHDNLGEEHPYDRVPVHLNDTPPRHARSPGAHVGDPAVGNLFFDFLGRLPEEQVRGDRRAQDCDDVEQEGSRDLDVRDQRGVKNLIPVQPDNEGSENVREEGQRQVLEDS